MFSDGFTDVFSPLRVCIIGAGPAAYRCAYTLLEQLHNRSVMVDASSSVLDRDYHITIFGEEPYYPYNRVKLSQILTEDVDLTLGDQQWWEDAHLTIFTHTRITAIDTGRKTIISAGGVEYGYDELIIATGSRSIVPRIPGAEYGQTYRTIADMENIRSQVELLRHQCGARPSITVIGGGVLGLEAAGELQKLEVSVHVVHSGKWLMSSQLDHSAGQILLSRIGQIGMQVYLGQRPQEIMAYPPSSGMSRYRVGFGDGSGFDTDMIVYCVGVSPCDELARDAGIECADRGGIVIDEHCRTRSDHVWAMGEVAAYQGICWGLIAPSYAMADIVALNIAGSDAVLSELDNAVVLKLAGVNVASFGDTLGQTPGCLEVVYADTVEAVYQKLVVADDGKTLLGAMFVGDISPYASLRPLIHQGLSADPSSYLSVSAAASEAEFQLPDNAKVCSCMNVSAGTLRAAINGENGYSPCADIPSLKAATGAGTQCGSCVPLMKKLLDSELIKHGLEVSHALCEHVSLSRSQLYDAVYTLGLTSASQIMEKFVHGLGCDICKPVIASILASQYNAYILDTDTAALQDTNDRALANMQKDGTYSVVPRIPAGEITPAKLQAIAVIAQKYELYTKITGAQRIDMFGARLEQLPVIWEELIEAGFESGYAYGKSLRTVKSCVGTTWCRYGVQDSVQLAIDLENRYKGLRSPHKIKMGVSGCARECAEARSKDVGVIATEKGWNLYVGGNGGFQPAHAVLLAQDLDTNTLIRYIDRYIMYYVRTAERLQRTARWQEEKPGGLDYIREVVCDDSLGIGEELENAIEKHRATYRDEWAEAINNPERRKRFRSYINAPTTANPELARIEERGQYIPQSPQ